jgi:tetratricopeptide (TPR) repeat protein
VDAAISEFTEAIKAYRKSYAAFYERCVAYSTKKRTREALADCKEAELIEPKFISAYFMEGYLHAANEEYPLALKCFGKVSSMLKREDREQFSAVKRMIAKLQLNLNRPDLALAAANALLQQAPFDTTAHLMRAQIEDKLGAYDKAVSDYSWTIEHSRSSEFISSAYGLRAKSYDLLHKPALSAQDRQSAKKMNQDFSDCLPFRTNDLNEKSAKN